MNLEHQQLLQRIEAFSLDELGAASPFTERLAQENHWDAAYARRVAVEYKRFAFLAVVAGHRVSPSDQVDQAWHLHLVFTDSYWNRFCAEVLRRPLHHQPSQGGAGERAKFGQWYEQTLASYRRLFGTEPPADIWPPAPVRASEDPHYTRVNTRRHWVIPKPSLRLVLGCGLGLLLCLTAGFSQLPRPIHATVTDGSVPLVVFLYIAALGVPLLIGEGVRRKRNFGPPLPATLPPPPADPYALAYLAHGDVTAVNAALVSLAHSDSISVTGKEPVVRRTGPLSDQAHPLERAIWERIGPDAGVTLPWLRKLVATELEFVADPLRESAWLLTREQRMWAAVVPSLIVALTIPLIAVMVLLAKDVAAAFGMALIPVIAIGVVLSHQDSQRRTRAADQLVSRLQTKHRALASLSANWDAVTPVTLALAVALFDLAPLTNTPLSELVTLLTPTKGTGHSNNCGGGAATCSSCGG